MLAGAALAAAGCGASQIYTTTDIPTPPDAGGCRLEISPLALAFGTVTLGSSQTQWVEFIDSGDALCELSQINIDVASDPVFSLEPYQPTTLSLRPGAAGGIAVIFTASVAPATRRNGSLTFVTNDPGRASATIPLSADVSP
jgi:hypothetical protein